jgi:predicted RNA-binding Zn-ribbon protein involved in translation (DUF1610 family)
MQEYEEILIDWQLDAAEEVKTKRFCPNCCNLVTVKLREHKHYQNFYACPICGDTIYRTGKVRIPSGYGYRGRRKRASNKILDSPVDKKVNHTLERFFKQKE